jgi:oligosaccharide repeat unit polymerase
MAALGVGVSLAIATALEATEGIRNIIRVDLLMLWILYLLTLLEFLFPQYGVDSAISTVAAKDGTIAVLLGFGGLAVGRHLIPWRSKSHYKSPLADLPPSRTFLLFIAAAFLGYLHMFLAVNFDPFEVIRQLLMPRFTQAWSRGRLGGDLFTLLIELGVLIYLIPPIAGLIYARPKDYNGAQKFFVGAVLFFTLFCGFASGTRNIIGTYVITFFGAYYLNRTRITITHVLSFGVPALLLLLLGSAFMLQFRQFGLTDFSFDTNQLETLSVDYNLVVISKLTEIFPSVFDYLGLEIPFNSLTHPIPRMLWPGKPEGLSVSVETALGADASSVTLASTFVGEAYIAGGFIGVLIAGVLFGAAAELWNRLGRAVSSPFAQLLYASGFFCAMLSMRSITWASVTTLPTIALWLYGKVFLRRTSRARAPVGTSTF